MKVDELNTTLIDFHAVNTLPTYENMIQVYHDLVLPPVDVLQL